MGNPWTPGPWRVEGGTTLIWGDCNPEDRSTYGMGYPVAECRHKRGWQKTLPTDHQIEANARLIAAAPEMAEALVECVGALSHGFDVERIQDRARALLARIRGETP